MSKSGTRVVLSFALALASGAFAFTGAANAHKPNPLTAMWRAERMLVRSAQKGQLRAAFRRQWRVKHLPSPHLRTSRPVPIRIHRGTLGLPWNASISTCRIRIRGARAVGCGTASFSSAKGSAVLRVNRSRRSHRAGFLYP